MKLSEITLFFAFLFSPLENFGNIATAGSLVFSVLTLLLISHSKFSSWGGVKLIAALVLITASVFLSLNNFVTFKNNIEGYVWYSFLISSLVKVFIAIIAVLAAKQDINRFVLIIKSVLIIHLCAFYIQFL